jgi:DNA repair ATPase RecN
MKKLYALISILFFLDFVSHAQVREIKQEMSFGIQTGLAVTILNADEKLVEKTWKKFAGDYGKIKRNRKANEQILQEATIPSISRTTKVDVFTTYDRNEFRMYVDMKDGFLNSQSHPDSYKAAEKMIQDFAYEVEREMTREELEKEEDALKDLEKKLKNLVDDNKDYKENIADAKEKIRQTEIKMNTKANIQSQVSKVEMVQKKLNSIGIK